MWKIVRIFAAMAVAGIVAFYVTLLSLGKPQSGNEALANARISIVAAILASLTPCILDFYMRHRGYEKARVIFGTLMLMAVSGIVPVFVAGFMLLEFGDEIHHYPMKRALWLGVYSLGIIGFLASGVIVWYLHNRGTRNGQSG